MMRQATMLEITILQSSPQWWILCASNTGLRFYRYRQNFGGIPRKKWILRPKFTTF
jgi:hypothetical protein